MISANISGLHLSRNNESPLPPKPEFQTFLVGGEVFITYKSIFLTETQSNQHIINLYNQQHGTSNKQCNLDWRNLKQSWNSDLKSMGVVFLRCWLIAASHISCFLKNFQIFTGLLALNGNTLTSKASVSERTFLEACFGSQLIKETVFQKPFHCIVWLNRDETGSKQFPKKQLLQPSYHPPKNLTSDVICCLPLYPGEEHFTCQFACNIMTIDIES